MVSRILSQNMGPNWASGPAMCGFGHSGQKNSVTEISSWINIFIVVLVDYERVGPLPVINIFLLNF